LLSILTISQPFLLSKLTEIFPGLSEVNKGTPAGQALNQFLAVLVTIAMASVGGIVTGNINTRHTLMLLYLLIGVLMRVVAKIERMKGEDFYNDDWNIADMEEKEEISSKAVPL